MIRTSIRSIRSVSRNILVLLLCVVAREAAADRVTYIAYESTWRFRLGTAEASNPVSEWRERTYDDSGWSSGMAPFGYGDPPFGVDLTTFDPVMRGNYACVFLRREFELTNSAAVAALDLDVDYDDGFIAWLNGEEILRVNMESAVPGSAVRFDEFADDQHESGSPETFSVADPGNVLVDGTNVLCVQVFNNQINSSDLKLDLELYDPDGPDVSPPAIASVAPAPGGTVRSLTAATVTFTEPVLGVDAADLLVAGSPATSVAGTGAGPYTFSFAEPPAGAVQFTWSGAHGITDDAVPPNALEPFAWSATLDPDAPLGDLVVSEILASNRTGITDQDGERSDWFEVWNRGTETVSAAGWSVSDDPDVPAKWIFPAVDIAPGDYIVVFASGKDRRDATDELHTSFRLSTEGEYFALFSPDEPRRAVTEFSPQFPDQRSDIAYGQTALGEARYLDPPTPGAPNSAATALEGKVAEPHFSVERGFFSGSIPLKLTATPADATIRYTLDGSEPTATRGTVYSNELVVEGTASRAVITVRAIATKSGYLPSTVVTHTYIFPSEVRHQPADPSGFPGGWGNHPDADYEIDPQVVGDARYSRDFEDGLLDLPSISIVMQTSDMFGSSGIYSNPGGEGVQWERAASVEALYPDGREGFNVNCGIRIQGGASRSTSKSAKHSFRFLFKGDYGPTKLRFPLFPDTDVDEFDTVILRAGYNNSWIHWDSGQRARTQYIRDQWIRDTQRDMGQPTPHGIFVHVYVNGLYWGLYNLVERPSGPFAASHLGGEREDYDALNSAEPVDGDKSAWNTMIGIANGGLSSNAAYENIQNYLDVTNLSDYMIVNFYGSNADWPSHNWYAARRRAAGAQYKFFSWDAERTFEGLTSNRTGVSNGDSPGILYSRLRANAEYRLLFADRVHRWFFNGGALTPTAVRERWLARSDRLERAVVCESARWGDYRRDVHQSSNGPYEFYRRDEFWIPEKNRLLSNYIPQRSNTVLSQFRSIDLYPDIGAPVLNQHGGEVAPGFGATLSRPAGTSGTIFVTTDGTDPREPISGDPSASAFAYAGAITIDERTTIQARVRSGSDWSALTDATFWVPSVFEGIAITEIMYNPLAGELLEFVEIGNLGATPVDLTGLEFTNGIAFTFEEHVLAPGEHVVVVAHAAEFSALYPGVSPAGVYEGRLANGGEKITLREPSGTTLVSVDYSDGGLWPVGPDGFGFSLVLADAAGDPDEPSRWRASAQLDGSPGEADPPASSPPVFINEVLATGAPPFEDAIELVNRAAFDVEVGGWYLSNNRESFGALRTFAIPDGTVIPAGGFAVLYESEFGGAFTLDDAGGAVYLSAASAGALTGHIVELRYRATEPQRSVGLHVTSNGTDITTLLAPTFGVEAPASVAEFRAGTGAANAAPLAPRVAINEIHYHPPFGVDEFVELFNPGGPIALYSGELERGWRIDGVRSPLGGDFEFLPGSALAAGAYALVVGVDPEVFRDRNDVPGDVPIFGPYAGALASEGERLRLLAPIATEAGGVAFVEVDQVRYNDRAPWPIEPDGEGPSLERPYASLYGNDPAHWAASDTDGGTPGQRNSTSPDTPNELPEPAIAGGPFSGSAPLEVTFDGSASTDPDGSIIEWAWSFGDGASALGEEVSHTYESAGSYSAQLTVTDNTGARTSASVTVTVAEGPGGGQIAFDINQDSDLNIADPIALLGYLFGGPAPEPPCDGGDPSGPGNTLLFNINGDAGVDVSDAIYALLFLFGDGAPPVLGEECTPIVGCPERCVP